MRNASNEPSFLVFTKWLIFSVFILGSMVLAGNFASAQQQFVGSCPPPAGTPPNVDGDGDRQGVDSLDDWWAQRSVDDKGNVDEVYCLDRTGNGNGYMFAKKYKPGGLDGRWVAKCNFPKAYNFKREGKCKGAFSKLEWDNYDGRSDADWEYEYDPQKDKLVIWRTKHSQDGDDCKTPPSSKQKIEKVYEGPAPENLDNLQPVIYIPPSEPCTTCFAFLGEFEYCPGSLQFDSPTFGWYEYGDSVRITVTRRDGSGGMVTVDYATSDGTATAGLDYTATSGTLTWPDGDMTPKYFTIPILDDSLYEGDETVNLTLSNPTGGATLGTPSTAVLRIIDDEPPPIPTLSQWVLILLALSVGGFFVWQLRRRRKAVVSGQ